MSTMRRLLALVVLALGATTTSHADGPSVCSNPLPAIELVCREAERASRAVETAPLERKDSLRAVHDAAIAFAERYVAAERARIERRAATAARERAERRRTAARELRRTLEAQSAPRPPPSAEATPAAPPPESGTEP